MCGLDIALASLIFKFAKDFVAVHYLEVDLEVDVMF